MRTYLSVRRQAEGTYFEGVSEVAGSCISLARPAEHIWADPFTKLATLRTDLTIDRGMSFEVRNLPACPSKKSLMSSYVGS